MKKKIVLVVFALVFLLSTVFRATAPIVGDVDGNGKVNMDDVVAVAQAYGSRLSDPAPSRWNENADLDHNNLIDIFDLVRVAINYGKIA